MPTVADLLLVEVQINTGGSARAVNAVSKELQGVGSTGQQAAQAASGASSAFSIQGQNALRLAGALIGVNVGLSAVSAIGREVHAVISDVIDTSARFGGTMAGVGAVSGATASQLARLSELAKSGGIDIGIGAIEGARGLQELVKGGVSVEAALGGGLRATELLAKAGGVDLAQAAEISAVAMNSFGLSAAQLTHVADLVAGAANASSIGVEDFRQSLSQTGAVARTVGVSFDDTAVAIAELGQAGIKGSDAGTSLRTFLLRLTPESKEAESAMRSLGIITADGSNKLFDASGRAKSLSDISQVLKTSLAGYTDQQKLATLQTVFGTDAVRAASVLAREGAAGFDVLAASMAKVSASDVARGRLNSIAGDMEKFSAEAERLKVNLAEGQGRGIVQGATQIAAGFNEEIVRQRAFQQAVTLAREEILAQNAALPFGGLRMIPEPLLAASAQTRVSEHPDRYNLQAFANAAAALDAANQSAASLQADTAASGGYATAVSKAVEQTNKLLKPARDLRAELDALANSGKGAAQGIGVLEAATAGLRLAGAGDITAVAALRAEAALRLREQAGGERAVVGQFRANLVTETTDAGASLQDRAKAVERLTFFDREVEAQTRLAQIEQQRASVDRTIQREQDVAKQASLQFELSQLPLQDASLQAKIAGLEIDQQTAPIKSQIAELERQITESTNQRLNLQREAAILLERQRSTPGRVGLEDNQARIRELQLELQTRDPSLDRGAIRREIRGLQRAQPGLELDVFRSDQTIRAIERQQAATRLTDDLHKNALEQQKVVLEGQLSPLERRRRLVEDAGTALQRLVDLDKAQFDQGQSGARGQLIRDQLLAAALGLNADDQKEALAKLGLPQAVQGPQPIAGQAGGNGPISVTIQNYGDYNVRSDADIDAIIAGHKQATVEAVATMFDRAATDATPPADTGLSGARRPMGQP